MKYGSVFKVAVVGLPFHLRMNCIVVQHEYINVSNFISETSPPWSEEECKNFEHALQMYDKNFHLIQKHKVSLIS